MKCMIERPCWPLAFSSWKPTLDHWPLLSSNIDIYHKAIECLYYDWYGTLICAVINYENNYKLVLHIHLNHTTSYHLVGKQAQSTYII